LRTVGFGYRIALAVSAYYTWKGTNLEGRGVEPQVNEPILTNALWTGEDNQLRRAAKVVETEDAIRLLDGRQPASKAWKDLETFWTRETRWSEAMRSAFAAPRLRRDNFRVITGVRKLERATGIEPFQRVLLKC
jgi:hypothetical protein